MSWLLSPSGWPSHVDDGGLLEARLLGDGWLVIDEGQVQAAVDAYNAGAVVPPAAVDLVSVAELQDSGSPASIALRAAFDGVGAASVIVRDPAISTDTITVSTPTNDWTTSILVRPPELRRRTMRVQNIGANPCGLAWAFADDFYWFGRTDVVFTLAPGEELVSSHYRRTLWAFANPGTTLVVETTIGADQ